MDDMTLCLGSREPPLNVGRPCPPCIVRLVSNMPHSGPSSVACTVSAYG